MRRFAAAVQPGPAISLLAFPRVDDHRRALSAGATAVLSKPVAMVRRKATQDAGYMAGLGSAGHHQRAHRRGRGLRLSAGLSRPRGQPRKPAAHACLRPGRGHLRRDHHGDPRLRVPRPGHRRRRPAWRLRLGPGWSTWPPPTSSAEHADPREINTAGHLGWSAKTPTGRSPSAPRPRWPAIWRLDARVESPGSSSRRRPRTSWIARASRPCRRSRRPGWMAQPDRVLLVGGSTRMPMVRDMMQQLFGKPPDTSVAADEAVAHGAALRAGLILAGRDGRPPPSRSERQLAQPGRGRHRPLDGTEAQTASSSPATPPCPVSTRRIFKTSKANQHSILVEIVEGESPAADDCTQIGRCSVHHLTTCPPSRPSKSASITTPAGDRCASRSPTPAARWKPKSSARTASPKSTWTSGGSTSADSTPPTIAKRERHNSNP